MISRHLVNGKDDYNSMNLRSNKRVFFFRIQKFRKLSESSQTFRNFPVGRQFF